MKSTIQYSSISCCRYNSFFSPRSYFSVEGLTTSITKRGASIEVFPLRDFIEHAVSELLTDCGYKIYNDSGMLWSGSRHISYL